MGNDSALAARFLLCRSATDGLLIGEEESPPVPGLALKFPLGLARGVGAGSDPFVIKIM